MTADAGLSLSFGGEIATQNPAQGRARFHPGRVVPKKGSLKSAQPLRAAEPALGPLNKWLRP